MNDVDKMSKNDMAILDLHGVIVFVEINATRKQFNFNLCVLVSKQNILQQQYQSFVGKLTQIVRNILNEHVEKRFNQLLWLL